MFCNNLLKINYKVSFFCTEMYYICLTNVHFGHKFSFIFFQVKFLSIDLGEPNLKDCYRKKSLRMGNYPIPDSLLSGRSDKKESGLSFKLFFYEYYEK